MILNEREYAFEIISHLISYGHNHFFISPGFRNSYLTEAVVTHPKSVYQVHYDERGTSFLGLGYGKASGKAAVVVVTSGTAVANCLPSVVEAKHSQTPMIILSADRPTYLIQQGENQTIQQQNIFSSFTAWQYSFSSFNSNINKDYIDSITQHTSYKSNFGAVHLNVPFQRPNFSDKKIINFEKEKIKKNKQYILPQLDTDNLNIITEKIISSKKIVFLIGNLLSHKNYSNLYQLLKKISPATFCDVTSGFRCYKDNFFFHDYELFLKEKDFKDCVIFHFGTSFVGKKILNAIKNIDKKNYFHFSEEIERYDPAWKINQSFNVDINLLSSNIISKINEIEKKKSDFNTHFSIHLKSYLKKWQDKKSSRKEIINKELKQKKCFEFSFFQSFKKNISQTNCHLFIGNSMPIRYLDFLGDLPFTKIFSNRGASGIDGNLATACGIQQFHYDKRIWLLIGDLTLLHDLNSLSLLKKYNIGIIVINNNGGNIFNFLPMKKIFNNKKKDYLASHGLDFKSASKMFDIKYFTSNNKDKLDKKILKLLKVKQSFLWEVMV